MYFITMLEGLAQNTNPVIMAMVCVSISNRKLMPKKCYHGNEDQMKQLVHKK